MTLGGLPPAPAATSQTTRLAMQANRSRDTGLELTIRRALHGAGLRYRKHVRPVQNLRCEPDVVFPREKVAVFVDGCWWHGCPEHWAPPRANRKWWTQKVELNAARDRRNDAALEEAGWLVVRVWEHEDVAEAVERVSRVIAQRRCD
jgi:DNA mismatch endonuclease (patch repair protein)